ncbi:DNA methylase N-4/N-6 [Syntrophomonas zehnderi OL-4]|uniref:DNA methylase N-4/N-6 n=1 Tax=Syntrophomonas zehnderi OL-4 TaxID=690567 RepID=A0A0E4GAZ7_9FIRM|nr:site-specific DNA-methyltransferase [Syntrophomonas zehnderi]CFX73936.1 DNA methylase N-4/N-6 [Syntrophomonas zehnderi OL-4]
MASLTENQKKLMDKLTEMFQFDQADLDFGIYRIMNYKRDEIRRFLENDLMSQISEKLAVLARSSNKAELEKIEKDIKNAQAIDLDEETKASMIEKLREKKAAYTVNTDIAAVEADIYSHLTEFFSRYYDEGDFISQRRYKDGVYAIPYEGEEVKLHWANADQYYIKTSEYFKDYTFKTPYGQTVHFKIVEAETEKDNNKSNEKRFFQLHQETPFALENGELFIYFEYKAGDKKKQADYNAAVIAEFTKASAQYPDFASLLNVTDGKSLLERQLNRYTARNTFDYFIHKDLGKFLNRELDFYIKNEVIFLDDIDEQDERKTKEYLLKAKIIRSIGKKIIAFLAQIEDFQKMLWLKKKFVVETNYCLTLDRVPKKLYPQIIENKAQVEEWVRLFAIDEITPGQPNLVEAPKAGFSDPLTIEFLEQNPYLVLDTGFFPPEFKEQLIDSIDNLDENLDGLLIHSENFQALNLLQERYADSIDFIHIDPPYNTETSGFLYKNNYRHSSWMSMMFDRLNLSVPIMSDNASFACHIDENEYERLWNVFEKSSLLNVGTVVWDKRNPMTGGTGLATQHEYVIWRSKNTVTLRLNNDNVQNMVDYVRELISKYGEVNEDVRKEYTNWINQNPNLTGGEKAYRYIDDEGRIYQSVSLRAPEPRTDPKFFQPLIHPITKKPCAIPPNGFSRTPETLQDMIKKGEILFGKDETTQPRQKMFLSIDTKRQMTSVIQNGMKGKADTDKLGVEFPYCHPVSFYEILVGATTDKISTILDYFAGSGTTAHAVINLNREDGGNRKYILVEMGEYFDTVTKPRVQKVIYSEDWKDGKPVSRKGISHAFKYLRLESYEDTLNNIEIEEGTLKFLTNPAVKEQYMLHYLLPDETRGSLSLLNIDMLDHPFDYAMNITRRQESKVTVIDLVETFNYLIGLKVERSFARQGFDAEFTTGEYGAVTARLRSGSTYRFKMVEGTTLSGDRVLVIWRDLTGDKIKDNAVLDAFFQRKKISTTDFEYKKIYVNGDNNLPNLRTDEESWKVVLIEEEMKKRMFSVENI